MMEESRTTLNDMNKKLDELCLETDQLCGRVEGLSHTTISGFDRISAAFSQVILLKKNYVHWIFGYLYM
jgi:hypothetical protein